MPQPSSWCRRGGLAALTALSLLTVAGTPATGTAASAAPPPTTSGGPAGGSAAASTAGSAGGSAAASSWSVERVGERWRVTLRWPGRVPTRDDLPVLLVDGRRLGVARMSADARSLSVETTDPRVERAGSVQLGWATAAAGDAGDGREADRRAEESAGPWLAPSGPVLPVDPARAGPYGVRTADYDLGEEAVLLPSLGHRSELRGQVYLPLDAPGRRPVVLFLHGMHDPCYGIPTEFLDEPWPCWPGTQPTPNHAGYAAMGRSLASHGYVVASISANAVNAWSHFLPDAGQLARGELVLAHLDLLRRGAAGDGPLAAAVRERVDLGRVGLMGHSRGGEGVVRAALMNTRRPQPYGIRGLFLIAPTDFARATVPGVSTTVLLPYCDGDVGDLQGQHYLDDTRGALRGDQSFRTGLLMLGANHNFFNTEWSPGSVSGGFDEWGGDPDATCGSDHPGRLTGREQRAAARAYLTGFFRVALGGEDRFMPLLDGSGGRAASAGRAVVRTTYDAPAGDRLDVTRLDDSVPGGASIRGDARLHVCAGMVLPAEEQGTEPPYPTTDDRHPPCTDDLRPEQAAHWSPSAFAAYAAGTPVGHLRWSSRAGRVHFPLPADHGDVRRYDALTMRMAPDPSVGGGTDLTVRVTDGRGRRVDVAVSEVSDALVGCPAWPRRCRGRSCGRCGSPSPACAGSTSGTSRPSACGRTGPRPAAPTSPTSPSPARPPAPPVRWGCRH